MEAKHILTETNENLILLVTEHAESPASFPIRDSPARLAEFNFRRLEFYLQSFSGSHLSSSISCQAAFFLMQHDKLF